MTGFASKLRTPPVACLIVVVVPALPVRRSFPLARPPRMVLVLHRFAESIPAVSSETVLPRG
jgi:hypothetical protein